MRPSPARKMAPEPESWIPIESLAALPDLEELLDPRFLVDSGQTRAVRLGEDGKGYVFVDAEIQSAVEHEQKAHRDLRHRRWKSHRRTLKMKRRVKFQKSVVCILAAIILFVVLVGARSFISAHSANAPMPVAAIVPTRIPVVIEGTQSSVYSVADSMKEFQHEHNLENLVPMQKTFDRSAFAHKRSSPALEFRNSKTVALTADGVTRSITTTDLTVADILSNNGIIVDGDDIVTPSRETPALGVKDISVTRVTTSTRTQDRIVAFSVVKQNDPTLMKGKTSIKRPGVNGSEKVVFTQTMNDGGVVSEVESSRVVTKAAVSQLVLVGTKNPQTQAGSATFYGASSGTCAHRTLPMGTIVTVTNTSTGASTTCRVADRGPFGAGRIIDLSKDAFSKIASTSQGVVGVTLTW